MDWQRFYGTPGWLRAMPRTTYHHLRIRTRLQLTFASKPATGTRQSSGLRFWIKSVERRPGPTGQDSEPFL